MSVINLKGGAGKTTTAGYAATVLHERGLRVLAIDADPQRTLSDWADAVDLGWGCSELASGRLHLRLDGIVDPNVDAVVIDTPPTEHDRGIALSAAKAATHVIVPVAPSSAEYQRMADTHDLLMEAQESDGKFEYGAFLVKVDPRSSSDKFYRESLIEDGWRVLPGYGPSIQKHIQIVGRKIENARATGYGDAVADLLGLES